MSLNCFKAVDSALWMALNCEAVLCSRKLMGWNCQGSLEKHSSRMDKWI